MYLSLKSKSRRKDFLVFGAPHILEEDIEEVVHTLRSGWLSTGPKVLLFEEAFRDYIGCKHAIAVNSCTSALHLALVVAGVKEGDEVITTPMTFASTANVIIHVGATPVFVDVEEDTFNIDPLRIEGAVSPRTKAIIPVHMAGRPCRMDEIAGIARKHHLVVIEDAAHAVGAASKGRKVGSMSDFAAFSFYPTKNLTTGEGGMLTTNQDERAELARCLSNQGITSGAWTRYSADGFLRYEALYPGFKYNMMDIQAALGLHQLSRLEANLRVREQHWARYNRAFAGLPGIQIPREDSDIRHARHLYTLLVDSRAAHIHRDQFVEELKNENIGSGIHFIALHLQKLFRERYSFRSGQFPMAESISDRTVSLPLSSALTENDIDDVIGAVYRILERCRRK